MMRRGAALTGLLCGAFFGTMALAQNPGAKPVDPLAPFEKVKADTIVLEHVRVIDGTGAPAKEDQYIEIDRRQHRERTSAPSRGTISRSGKAVSAST